MIAMTVPFDEHREVLAIIRAKVERDAPDVRNFRPDVAEMIATRLSQVLAREPGLRPNSARAVLTGIEELLKSM
jgi:hypothetical protein